MDNNNDIFNLKFDDFAIPKKEQKSAGYKPDPAKAKDGVYKAIIRFIPNLKDPTFKGSVISKTTYWLKDDPNSFGVDCPTSIGEKSIINETFWKLKNSDSAYEQNKATQLQRKKKHFAYIYIVKDFQDSELDGTVQLYSFPTKIYEKIEAQLQPDKEAIEMGAEPANIFDFFEGKDFLLKIKVKADYWNYDDCQFVANKSAIKVNGTVMERNQECFEQIKKLYDNVRPLEDFKYKPWDSETRAKVHAFLHELTGGNVPSAAISKVSKPDAKPTGKPAAVHADTSAEGSDLVLEKNDADEKSTAPSSEEGEDMESFLKQFEA